VVLNVYNKKTSLDKMNLKMTNKKEATYDVLITSSGVGKIQPCRLCVRKMLSGDDNARVDKDQAVRGPPQ